MIFTRCNKNMTLIYAEDEKSLRLTILTTGLDLIRLARLAYLSVLRLSPQFVEDGETQAI